MKGSFPGYEDNSTRDFRSLWSKALFVFDTNVLLNLYRYQRTSRLQFLDVLNQLSSRAWIPHHVALEFHRNRNVVIAEQNRRYSEVKEKVRKAQESLSIELDKLQLRTRHSSIDPQPLLEGIQGLVTKFLSDLDELQKQQQPLGDPDPIRTRLETIFEGRVGKPPESQSDVDKLYSEADLRFQQRLPPGYFSDAKDTDEEPLKHTYGGIVYNRRYGDFLVWHQLLLHAKENATDSVIFITDDAKQDWWWKVKSEGPKTLGPRPELVDEAKRVAGIQSFHMYSPEGFLKFANDFLAAAVSRETLEEVRDVSVAASRVRMRVGLREFEEKARVANEAFSEWLFEKYSPKFLVTDDSLYVAGEWDGGTHGYALKLVFDLSSLSSRVVQVIKRSQMKAKEDNLSDITVVWIVDSAISAASVLRRLQRSLGSSRVLPHGVNMLVGVIKKLDSGQSKFHEVWAIDSRKE